MIEKYRIAKFIASTGLCSRREAERLIEAGRVSLNDEIILSPAMNITNNDIVKVDDKIIARQEKVQLWLYHKPVGIITTHKDEKGRPTVFEQLEGLPRVISVGRLDLNSEGLLLLTNNGEFARKLELPENKFDRTYLVRAYGNPGPLMSAGLKFRIESFFYQFKSLKLTKPGANSWFEVTLQEGKNREIRRVFEHFGLRVSRLIRTSYAGYKLGELKAGEYREISIK